MNNIFGWESIDKLASQLYNDPMFSTLLNGYLVFAYKNLKNSGTIKELYITKKLEGDKFMIGMLPLNGGWTYYDPNASIEYIREIIFGYLKENKTDKDILNKFIESINIYGK